MPRRCPKCQQDSIIGHGWRQKQAHDQHHDWIDIHRGLCSRCQLAFTFLPCLSPAYTHYSLMARSEALRRRFVEGRSWESSAPTVKDPNRVASPGTLRRWALSLDASHPPFSRLRQMLAAVSQWLSEEKTLRLGTWRLSWPTVALFLRQCCPFPLRL